MYSPKLKIAVNTRLLLPGKLEGIGWFTCESFRRIVLQNPEVDFYFLFDRPFAKDFVFGPNVKPVVLYPQARHPLLYLLYFEVSLNIWLNRVSPDVFVSPDGFLSLSWKGKQIPVIHDLNFMHHPDFLPWADRVYYRKMFPLFAKKATRVATVSEYSKGDIEKTLHVSPAKIDVVYNGVNPVFTPLSFEQTSRVRDEFTSGHPYFVYVGSLHKRKNIENMLLAFDRFRQNDPGHHKFVIVGEPMFESEYLQNMLSNMVHAQDVVFLGRLYENNLHKVVASARALMLVSHFEGFGIPIIEAMACGVPVITSDVSSMPEIAGDAALLVSPTSVNQIADAMHSIAGSEVLRNEMINKGYVVVKKFSWEVTAQRLWGCIEKCLQ